MDSSTLVEKILELKDDPERSWEKDLTEIGVWEAVSPLYGMGRWDSTANTMVAFIILAYSNKSNWIDSHRDRILNKKEILIKLGVKDTSSDRWQDLIYKRDEKSKSVIEWFINWQKDWRWEAIITHLDYYSNMMAFAQSKTPSTKEVLSQGIPVWITATHSDIAMANQKKGDLITQATEIREKADQLMSQIRREYIQLDTICEQEDRIKVTEDFDQGSLEYYHYIKEQQAKQRAKESINKKNK